MTDKELLELAAKAAGWVYLTNGQTYIEDTGNVEWNPLTDDGDALRLAVKLDIPTHSEFVCRVVGEATYQDNPYAATRRAIVRAAAEIGKEMK